MQKHLFIDGQWVEAKQYIELKSPFSQEVIAHVPSADQIELDTAIAAACRAADAAAKMPAHKRADILEKVAMQLNERKDEAARIIALEAAKPLKIALGEIDRTVQTYKFAAEEAKRIYGETIPMDAAPGGEGRIAYTVKKPIGVIGAITPFNFPFNLVAHKVGPAIAAGNTIVLKPASQTPLSAYFIAELFEEAGLPKGILNVVTGPGSIAGNALVADDRVSMITFTGSPEVGMRIRSQAGLKRVTLELGSNSALIVDQGVHINKMINRCVMGAFSNQGQVCISLQRIYVHEQIYEQFVEQFKEQTMQLKMGNPLDSDTDVSALIAKKECERVLEWLDEAKQEGAWIAAGGHIDNGVLAPTIVLEAAAHLKISCQEIFAPVVVINKVSSIHEAIKLVNDSQYGLQAGIYTNDIHTALQAADELQVGGVMINDIPTFRVDHMPYGGVKESGTGREGIKYAVEEMTELKLIVMNRAPLL